MAAMILGLDLILSGNVGCFDGEDGFNANDVRDCLAAIGKTRRVTIHLNSGGGIASEGPAIAAVMNAHPGQVDVVIEGIAASAASIVAVSGSRVTIAPGSVIMIHDPAALTIGDASDHEASTAMLNTMGEAYASIYATRTSRPAAEMRRLMKAETWMTAEDAVAKGFADAIVGSDKSQAVAAFDYGKYRHAPDRIVAMWRDPRSRALANKSLSGRALGLASMTKILASKGLKPVERPRQPWERR